MRKTNILHHLVRRVTAPGQAARRLLGLIGLLGLLSLATVQADGPRRVGLVVAQGDKVIKKCIEFSEEKISGYEVLRRAGLDLNVDAGNSMGAAVCRIDGTGCAYPQEDCFCQCQGSPCRFWIYWHWVDGDWQFSGLGASNYEVHDGDVEGWVWGEGSPNNGGAQPPRPVFEEICAEPPTATPTPTPTSTNTPLPPTATATSTPTPTRIAAPVIHRFSADRSAIDAGESIVLSWDLSNARAAYLRYNGSEEGVTAPGSKTVSPGSTTVYTLVARNDGGETRADITITVAGAPPAPNSSQTPTPAPAPAGEVVTAAAPEPVIEFGAGSSTVPAGACTTLAWEVQHAGLVYLDESQVEPQGSRAACPTQTRRYTLRVLYPGGERATQVILLVPETTPDLAALPALPSPTPGISPTAGVTLAAVAAPAAALAPTRPVRRDPARSPAGVAEREPDSRLQGVLAYGGVAIVITLFLAAPLALLVAGWVAWGFRRKLW
ncbi:MAG: hypothetical protein AB1801_15930 [Chloroflexota bacterium]